VALLLKASFDTLGVSCDVYLNEFASDRINIVLGGHMLGFDDRLRHFPYIPYQLEQLNTGGYSLTANLTSLLRNATEVWDYSAENVAFLSREGITARRLPLGYHPRMEQIPNAAEQDVDVLFYGSIGERRKPLLNRLSGCKGLRFKLLFGAYGIERDAWVSRSKVILNVHYYQAKILEAVRVSYLVNNKCFVLSEESASNPYSDIDLCFAAYEDLEERCRYFLSHSEERDQRRLANYARFRENYPMTEYIRELIHNHN
jgi:hypothetical protein